MPRGLYLLTPDDSDTGRLLARLEPLLPFATWLQYRNKTAAAGLRVEQAAAVQALCTGAGVPLVVNDDPALALRIGAAGVHLGASGWVEDVRPDPAGRDSLGFGR